MKPLFGAAVFLVLLLSRQGGSDDSCLCDPLWAMCKSGEVGSTGCDGKGLSCADICQGDFVWKPLYREMVRNQSDLLNECSSDPTSKWGTARANSDGPFAIAFAGGLRNFFGTWPAMRTNLVEASGGNVDLYFHVWSGEHFTRSNFLMQKGRELAKSLPQTKGYIEERIFDYFTLLKAQEPKYCDRCPTNEPWFYYPENSLDGSPFSISYTYSQWRKVCEHRPPWAFGNRRPPIEHVNNTGSPPRPTRSINTGCAIGPPRAGDGPSVGHRLLARAARPPRPPLHRAVGPASVRARLLEPPTGSIGARTLSCRP
jgi:hypothetical protein